MDVTCSQKELAKGLAMVQRAVNVRSPLPVLGNILLEAKDGELRLAATNLAISTDCWIRAEVTLAGAITIPARLFCDIVGKLLPGKVSLKREDGTVSLWLRCGNFNAKLRGIDAEEFPQTALGKASECASLNPKQLAEMIGNVAFVASRDESRPALFCVKIALGPRLTMAATDGYRLGVRSAHLSAPASETNVLIRAASMVELGRLLADADSEQPVAVSIDAAANRMAFGVQGNHSFLRAIFVAQLVDAKYPDYHAIIPRSVTTTTAVDAITLLRAMQTVRLFAKGESEPIHLCADSERGRLRIQAEDDLMGGGSDEVDAEIKGPSIEFALDVGFLIDVVSRAGDTQLVIETTKPTHPICVRPFAASPDEFIHVIMPINKNGRGARK